MTAVYLYPPAATTVTVGGEAITAVYGPVLGGFLVNPATIQDQNIPVLEVLYVDIYGPATLGESPTTIPLQPGQTFIIPNQTTSVSVNAKTSGHRFSGVIYQGQTPPVPTPQPGTFPPSGPTTLTEVIPSYLYQQYNDDDDLQAFVAAYNALAQGYVTWFAVVGLAVYTGPLIVGSLLDWVAQGIYGFVRPALASGLNRDIGPYNTWAFNTLAYDKRQRVGPRNVTVTSDDIFKRIITWNFYKGDGNTFNVRWLKRRIMRFLIGTNGTAPNVDQTYPISVTFGPGVIAIRITVGTRVATGGMLYDRFGFNGRGYTFNSLQTKFTPGPTQLPFEPIFKEAMLSGALQIPFQYNVIVEV